MPQHCCIPGCNSDGGLTRCEGLSFHRFPTYTDQKEKWIDQIRQAVGKDKVFALSKHTRICSLHFQDSAYQICSPQMPTSQADLPTLVRKRLQAYAFPTVFPSNPTNSEKSNAVKLLAVPKGPESQENLDVPTPTTSTMPQYNFPVQERGDSSSMETSSTTSSLVELGTRPSLEKASVKATNLELLQHSSEKFCGLRSPTSYTNHSYVGHTVIGRTKRKVNEYIGEEEESASHKSIFYKTLGLSPKVAIEDEFDEARKVINYILDTIDVKELKIRTPKKPLEVHKVVKQQEALRVVPKLPFKFENNFDRVNAELGLELAQTFVHSSFIREHQSALDKSATRCGRNYGKRRQKQIELLSEQLSRKLKHLRQFRIQPSDIKACNLCPFKTSSANVLLEHKCHMHAAPQVARTRLGGSSFTKMYTKSWRCCLCNGAYFEGQGVFVAHMKDVHGFQATLEADPSPYTCSTCFYDGCATDCRSAANHMLECHKRFDIKTNLAPPYDVPYKYDRTTKIISAKNRLEEGKDSYHDLSSNEPLSESAVAAQIEKIRIPGKRTLLPAFAPRLLSPANRATKNIMNPMTAIPLTKFPNHTKIKLKTVDGLKMAYVLLPGAQQEVPFRAFDYDGQTYINLFAILSKLGHVVMVLEGNKLAMKSRLQVNQQPHQQMTSILPMGKNSLDDCSNQPKTVASVSSREDANQSAAPPHSTHATQSIAKRIFTLPAITKSAPTSANTKSNVIVLPSSAALVYRHNVGNNLVTSAKKIVKLSDIAPKDGVSLTHPSNAKPFPLPDSLRPSSSAVQAPNSFFSLPSVYPFTNTSLKNPAPTLVHAIAAGSQRLAISSCPQIAPWKQHPQLIDSVRMAKQPDVTYSTVKQQPATTQYFLRPVTSSNPIVKPKISSRPVKHIIIKSTNNVATPTAAALSAPTTQDLVKVPKSFPPTNKTLHQTLVKTDTSSLRELRCVAEKLPDDVKTTIRVDSKIL